MLLMPVDSWSANSYTTPLDPYTYPSTSMISSLILLLRWRLSWLGYLPPYPTPSPFHPPSKYGTNEFVEGKENTAIDSPLDHHGFDSDFLGNYGQPRSTTSDASHAQQSSMPSPPAQQPVKEIARTSKLSATAPTFSHRTPMETSSPTPTGYAGGAPAYTMPPQYSPIDNRVSTQHAPFFRSVLISDVLFSFQDNHYSVNYGTNNHRNNYYHSGQQQRSYQNNTSNNNWHSQQ